MSSAALVFCFQVLAIAGCGLTAFALHRRNLHTRYKWFFRFFLFRVVDNTAALVILWSVGVKSAVYFQFWCISTYLLWLFYVMVVLELYRLILAKHPGLYTLGRWGFYVGMGLAVGFSLLMLLPKIGSSLPARSKTMFRIMAVDRGANFGLACFLVITIFFVSLYPVPLSRNVKLHTVLYTLFFLSSSLGSLLHTFFNMKYADSIDTGLLAFNSGCTLLWFFFLQPKGEEARAATPALAPEYESRLLQQIESLNSTLMKVSRN